jgi:hypothetical protein
MMNEKGMGSKKAATASLAYLAFVQVGTAVAILIPGALPAFGIKAPPPDLALYLYFCASLYFALGLLYLLGALKAEYRKAALTVAPVDVLLELLSLVFGFPLMGAPYWLIAVFSLALLVPGILCLLGLKEERK